MRDHTPNTRVMARRMNRVIGGLTSMRSRLEGVSNVVAGLACGNRHGGHVIGMFSVAGIVGTIGGCLDVRDWRGGGQRCTASSSIPRQSLACRLKILAWASHRHQYRPYASFSWLPSIRGTMHIGLMPHTGSPQGGEPSTADYLLRMLVATMSAAMALDAASSGPGAGAINALR